MKNFDLNVIKNPEVRQIVSAILEEKVIKEHVIDYSWASGCVTDVAPIMVMSRYTEVQMDTQNKAHFVDAINRVLRKYPNIFKNGYFCKTDGSCPAYIRFEHTNVL